jgi:NAD(P)-dependent dehydrogenase (short-subunit alcohol dehydrogenase family)
MSNFAGRTVAISGAASGIGLATARLLAASGARVSLADTNHSVKAAADALPGSHMHTIVDVRNAEAVDTWIGSTVKRFGKLDGAVNMAGILNPAKPLVETTDEDWDKTFAVNAKGMFNCLRAEIEVMSMGGSIVSKPVSSQSSHLSRLSFSSSLRLSWRADENPGLGSQCIRPIWRNRLRAILRD